MPCELADDTAWPALLVARTLLAGGEQELRFVRDGRSWTCVGAEDADLHDAEQVLAVSLSGDQPPRPTTLPPKCAWSVHARTDTGVPHFVHPTGQPVDATILSTMRVYLPVLLGAAAARAAGRVFVAGHVTQTLDGRIACENGQSQWIGNSADLQHAHRMRALLDGVLIGAGTALTDNPRLNVRHVRGPDPNRIVLSGGGRVLQRPDLHVFSAPGCFVITGHDVIAADQAPTTRLVRVPADGSALEPGTILTALRQHGIHSIYLEGGALSLSSFLRAGCIDLLQVHIAAMLLGSGLPSFRLPPVDHVRHGIAFAMDHAMLDGHVLLSCWPQASTPG